MKKECIFVLMSTDGYVTYDKYLDYCKKKNMKPEVDGNDMYWKQMAYSKKEAIENFFENLSKIKYYDKPCLIMPYIGIQHLSENALPIYFANLEVAIKYFCLKDNVLDFKVVLNTYFGKITMRLNCKDGLHIFTISPLSKKGRNKIGKDLSNYKDYWFNKYNWNNI